MTFVYSLRDTEMNIQGSHEGHKKSENDTVKSQGVCTHISKIKEWPHKPPLYLSNGGNFCELFYVYQFQAFLDNTYRDPFFVIDYWFP